MIASRPAQVPDIGSSSGVDRPGRVLGEHLANRVLVAGLHRRDVPAQHGLAVGLLGHLRTPCLVGLSRRERRSWRAGCEIPVQHLFSARRHDRLTVVVLDPAESVRDRGRRVEHPIDCRGAVVAAGEQAHLEARPAETGAASRAPRAGPSATIPRRSRRPPPAGSGRRSGRSSRSAAAPAARRPALDTARARRRSGQGSHRGDAAATSHPPVRRG